ncbi:MAG: DUF6624 domain-containing protein [Syntrophothermus sp.]
MNTKFIFITMMSIMCSVSFAQDKYKELTNEAKELFQNEEYFQAGIKYHEAFLTLGNRGLIDDRYRAACAWSLANRPDSAFIQLFKILQSGHFDDYDRIVNDKNLISLHSDIKWKEIIGMKDKAEAKYDKKLKAILDSVYSKDQKYRAHIHEIINTYGPNSNEVKVQNQVILKTDSANLIIVKEILDKRGWVGRDIVGRNGSNALFLVMQHSDLKTQERYLPMMQEAVKKGNLDRTNLALLEDRILIGQGKKQIYGSQIGINQETKKYYILPLEDPDNVDKRREEIGLGKLQNYVSQWGIIWDVEEYKKQL